MITTINNKTVYRYKIELVTNADVVMFNKIASRQSSEVYLVGPGMKINAKSFIGTHLARVSWNKLELETEFDSYVEFKQFIVD